MMKPYHPTKYKEEIQELKAEIKRLQRLLARAIIQLSVQNQTKIDREAMGNVYQRLQRKVHQSGGKDEN